MALSFNGGFIGISHKPLAETGTTGPKTTTFNSTNPAFELLRGTTVIDYNLVAGGGGGGDNSGGGGGGGGVLNATCVSIPNPGASGYEVLVQVGGGGNGGRSGSQGTPSYIASTPLGQAIGGGAGNTGTQAGGPGGSGGGGSSAGSSSAGGGAGTSGQGNDGGGGACQLFMLEVAAVEREVLDQIIQVLMEDQEEMDQAYL